MSLVLLFAWLATSWDAFFPLYDVAGYSSWLAGWSHAGRVCLSDSDTTCARDQESRAETIVLYPLKWTTPPSVTPPAHQLTLQGSIGLIIWHYLHKFTKIDSLKIEIVHILVIITAVTQIRGNRQKSRYKSKITVITAIVNS